VSIETQDARDTRLTLAETLADRHADQQPFEQARVNIDYPAIFRQERVSKKARQVFRMLSAVRGYGNGLEIAAALKISPGRVCQLKDELARALEKHGYRPYAVAESWYQATYGELYLYAQGSPRHIGALLPDGFLNLCDGFFLRELNAMIIMQTRLNTASHFLEAQVSALVRRV
jgi:hypothetical protein